MRRAHQVLADVAEEMQMTGEYGDARPASGDERVGRLGHGAPQVAHDGARGAEQASHLVQLRQDELRSLGRDLPGAQYPTAPAGIDRE